MPDSSGLYDCGGVGLLFSHLSVTSELLQWFYIAFIMGRKKSIIWFLFFKNDKGGEKFSKMKVGESCSQAWELEGTRRTNWERARADLDSPGSPNSPRGEGARHMSNFEVTRLQREADVHQGPAILGGKSSTLDTKVAWTQSLEKWPV